MNTRLLNTRLLSLSAALLAALPLAAQAQTTATAPTASPVTLRYKWTPGEVRYYKMTMDMNMAMTMAGQAASASRTMPAMAQHMVMAYDTAVQSVNPDGSAILTEHITQMTATLNGQPIPGIGAIANAYKGGFTVVMSPAGKVLSMQLPPAVAGQMPPGMDLSKMGSMVPAILPDAPIQIGDTWQSNTDLPMFGQMPGMPAMQLTVFSTLAGVSKGAQPIADIHQAMQGTLGGAVPAGAAGSASMAGQFHGDTSLKFDVDKGSVVGQDGTITMDTTVALPNMPDASAPKSMRMQMQMTTHLERLAGASR